MSYRLNLELVMTQPVLNAVKNYGINLPEICITAVLAEIERLDSINSGVARTTPSTAAEIRVLKEELNDMREKLEKAEEAVARHKQRAWRT